MPDDHWDATAGKIKDETKFGEWVRGNAAAVAAETSRRLTLPQSPDAYKTDLPASFKPPEGLKFEIDAKDPLIAQYREMAHKRGFDQETFSEGLGMIAALRVGEAAQIKAAYEAEVTKLGAAGPARVDAVTQWLGAVAGDAAKPLMTALKIAPVADTVIAFEKLMKTFQSQGVTPFSQAHRSEQPQDRKIPGYESMTFEQRRHEQEKRRAAAAGGR